MSILIPIWFAPPLIFFLDGKGGKVTKVSHPFWTRVWKQHWAITDNPGRREGHQEEVNDSRRHLILVNGKYFCMDGNFRRDNAHFAGRIVDTSCSFLSLRLCILVPYPCPTIHGSMV